MRASTTGELLVTLGLRLCAIAAGDRRSAGRLRYYPLDWESLFVVLVTPMYCVMPLQEIPTRSSACPPGRRSVKELEEQDVPSSKAHVAGEAFEWLDIGIYPSKSD